MNLPYFLKLLHIADLEYRLLFTGAALLVLVTAGGEGFLNVLATRHLLNIFDTLE